MVKGTFFTAMLNINSASKKHQNFLIGDGDLDSWYQDAVITVLFFE